MMDDSALFVDTNSLVYATNSASPWHQLAQDRLSQARQLGIEIVISTEIVREYLAVATRSSVTSGSPTLAELLENVRVFRTEFTVLQNSSLVLDNLMGLLQTIPVAGKQVHDANIVATMQAYRIKQLLTHNTADFARFAHLIQVVPLRMEG